MEIGERERERVEKRRDEGRGERERDKVEKEDR